VRRGSWAVEILETWLTGEIAEKKKKQEKEIHQDRNQK